LQQTDPAYELVTPEILSSMKVDMRRLDALPLIMAQLKEMGISEVIDRYCPTGNQAHLTNGQVIALIVANFLNCPTALYTVEDWANYSGIEDIWGIKPEYLNDDRLARALDAIHPHLATIRGEISLHCIEKYNIPLKKIHWDLTHFSFTGAYNGQSRDYARILTARSYQGYPVDKQIKVQTNVVLEENTPVPVWGMIADGTACAFDIAEKNMKELKQYLKAEGFVCIGDSGSFSSGMVDTVVGKHKSHIIVAAKMYSSIRKVLTGELDKGTSFERLTYLSQEQLLKTEEERDYYYGFEVSHVIVHEKKSYPVRLLFIKSDGKLKRDRKRREKRIERLKKDIEKLADKLNGLRSKKEETVSKKMVKMLSEREEGKYITWNLFRDEVGLLQLSWTFDDKEYWTKEGRFDGMYALMTSLPPLNADGTRPQGDLPATMDEIFRAYKEQTYIERSHRMMKEPVRVRPIYLHKQKRIESLLTCLLLSLQAHSIIQLLYRRGVRDAKEKKRTTNQLLGWFRNYSIVYIWFGEQKVVKQSELTQIQKYLLETLCLNLDMLPA
jgi:transposase